MQSCVYQCKWLSRWRPLRTVSDSSSMLQFSLSKHFPQHAPVMLNLSTLCFNATVSNCSSIIYKGSQAFPMLRNTRWGEPNQTGGKAIKQSALWPKAHRFNPSKSLCSGASERINDAVSVYRALAQQCFQHLSKTCFLLFAMIHSYTHYSWELDALLKAVFMHQYNFFSLNTDSDANLIELLT